MVSFGGVGFPLAFSKASGGSPAVNMASFERVAMIGVETLGVGFPTSCQIASEVHLCQIWRLVAAS
jgi:hypothetical protein